MKTSDIEALRAVCETDEPVWKIDHTEAKGDGQIILLHGKTSKLIFVVAIDTMALKVHRELERLTRLVC